MNSIADLVDKLVIENIKLFNIREKLNTTKNLTDPEYVELTQKMMILNENRGLISNELDSKIERVVTNKEKNQILKKFKTYDLDKK